MRVKVRSGDGAYQSNSTPTSCLNCGYVIDRNFCSNCGQHKANHNAGVWLFIQEFLEEFIRFDSKLLRTLIPLVTKPGLLTKEWAEGKRVRYISPLKLYITISALCFVVISMRATNQDAQLHVHTAQSSSNQLSLVDSLLNQLTPDLPSSDPKILREHFFSHLPTASLIVVPIAALILCCLYIRPKRYYVEHLVFMLHYNTFCFLSFGLSLLFPLGDLQFVASVIAIGYLLLAMKKNYEQSWSASILKFGVFTSLYSVLVLIAILGTVVVSAYMASLVPGMGHTMPSMHSH